MSSLVIRGAHLLAPGAEAIADAVVIAQDQRITYAGTAAGAPAAPDDALAVDADGRWLTPGLIDCHVHLCFDGVPDFMGEAAVMTPVTAAIKATRNALQALEAGITSVRDLGGIGSATIDVARAQRDGVITGTRVHTAGEVLTITGGHGHFFGREADTADELVKAARDLRKAGADLIKVMATGGVLTPGIGAQRSAFSVEQLTALVEEAHEAGMRVAAHSIGNAGIVSALRAGVDSIEHGCFLSDEAFKLMLDNPSWLVPTLCAPHQIRYGGEGVPEFAVEKSDEVMVSHADSFAHAVEAGVRIASGTDAGTPFNPHGGLPLELRLMHEAGLPLDRVLVAATTEAAALIGRDDIGGLGPGQLADLIMLDGDPYADVRAYERVSFVAQGARVIVDRR